MKRPLTHLLAALIGLALAGCAASGGSSKDSSSKKSSAFGASSHGRSVNPEEVQRDVMNFADRFAGSMAGTYDQLARRATTPAAKNAALERKIGNVSAAYINATEFSPLVGLIDMMVLVSLVRNASEEPWYIELYGDAEAATVANVLRAHETDIWNVGRRYLTQSQLDELRGAIERWQEAHRDQHYVSTVRLPDFPEAKSAAAAGGKKDGGGSVFGLVFMDPLSGLEPTRREVVRSRESAERMFFFAQRMPILFSWQSEALSQRVLEQPRVQQLAGATTRFSEFADSTRSLVELLRSLPQTIDEQRQKLVDLLAKQVAEQRSAAVQQVAQATAVERDAALRQSADIIAQQRDAAVKQIAQAVADERKEITRVATQAVASEREAVVAAWNQSLQSQRQALVTDMERASGRTVNRVFVLALVVVALGILLTAAAVLLVRRIGRRAPADAYKPVRQYIVETAATGDDIRITKTE